MEQKEEKLKFISEIVSVTDFLENTFAEGVKGFGLHKKSEGRDDLADLDSCKAAHEKMGEYLRNILKNIKEFVPLPNSIKAEWPPALC